MRADKIKSCVSYSKLLFISILVCAILCKKKPEENFLEPVNISHNSGYSFTPSIAIDSKGTVHLVWYDISPGNEEILYAYKPAGDAWSEPDNISNNSLSSRFPSMAIDKNDNIHLAWQQSIQDTLNGYSRWVIFYSYKSLIGNWSEPETLRGGYHYVKPELVVDDECNVYLIWKYGGYYPGIRYAERTKEGMWSSQVNITEPVGILEPAITVDKNRNVHLTWDFTDWSDMMISTNIFYSMKTANGTWTSPVNISNTNRAQGTSCILTDAQGSIHCIWDDDTRPYLTPKILYRVKNLDETWSTIIPPCTTYKARLIATLAIGPQEELYIPGTAMHNDDDKQYLLYVKKPQEGEWSDTIICGVVLRDPYDIDYEDLACDKEGTLYFIGEKGADIFCIEYKLNRGNDD